jgi:hypothetical protein
LKLTTASKQIKPCKLSSREEDSVIKDCFPARCTCCHRQIYPNSINSYHWAYNNNLAAVAFHDGFAVVCPSCFIGGKYNLEEVVKKQGWATMTVKSNLAHTKVFLSNEFLE